MLHDLANDGGFVTLKQAAEDREYETQRKDVKNLLNSRKQLMMMTVMMMMMMMMQKFILPHGSSVPDHVLR